DQTTGEVFFGTTAGIISYQGDATIGASNCEDVLVFPNPVFTDFDGLINIRGTAAESTVKITTVSGLLVREVESQGGTATWDGRDVYGNKVRSGVYLALIANKNGENACIGKFSVIAR
ncbi:MAG: Por secretion system protein, partial [Bacteroidota bacterium]